MTKRSFLAYCGIYCEDCLGFSGVIADAARDFLNVLDKYEFEKTALNVFPEPLAEYDSLIDMFMFMEDLRCVRFCRELDGGESKCEIRHCCVDNGFFACYECDHYNDCEKLKRILGELHYESCIKNHREINRLGLENWLTYGKKHHYWDT